MMRYAMQYAICDIQYYTLYTNQTEGYMKQQSKRELLNNNTCASTRSDAMRPVFPAPIRRLPISHLHSSLPDHPSSVAHLSTCDANLPANVLSRSLSPRPVDFSPRQATSRLTTPPQDRALSPDRSDNAIDAPPPRAAPRLIRQ